MFGHSHGYLLPFVPPSSPTHVCTYREYHTYDELGISRITYQLRMRIEAITDRAARVHISYVLRVMNTYLGLITIIILSCTSVYEFKTSCWGPWLVGILPSVDSYPASQHQFRPITDF